MRIIGFSRVVTFISLLLSALSVSSQEMLHISGSVFDQVTGKELPYAQVSVRNSTIGTVTNDEGRFSLEVPALFGNDTLRVAYMGYNTLKVIVSGLAGDPVRLPLSPGVLQLAEVEIVAFSPEDVIRQVVAHIPANYGKEPVILTAFVRSQKFVNGRLAEYTEAIIEDLKTGYDLYDRRQEKEKNRLSNVPLLLKGRVISDTGLVNSIGDLGRSAGCLGCNFIHDFAEFYHQTVLDEKLFKYYAFRMEELIRPEGGKIYHIWFDQKKGVRETLWKGELFINANDFALLKLTQRPSFEAFEQFEKKKYNRQFMINGTAGWYQEMPMMEWTTTYSARNGNYYLNTIRVENWLTFKHTATMQMVKFAHKNEVVVTDATREQEKILSFKGDKSTGVNQRWDQVVGKGDERFWAGYNYLPIEEKLRKSLRELMSW